MKYFFCLLLIVSLFGCQKKEDPCLDYMIDPIAYSPLVFSFIDADSTNLLENNKLDIKDILIKDNKGSIQKLDLVLDSTGKKVRYITIPALQNLGTNELKINAKNIETSLKYDFIVRKEPCIILQYFDNYVLDSNPYKLKFKQSYYMSGKKKIPTIFRIVYITE